MLNSLWHRIHCFIGEAFAKTLGPPPRRVTAGAWTQHPYLNSELQGVGVVVVDRTPPPIGTSQDQTPQHRVTPVSAVAIACELAARGALIALVLDAHVVAANYGTCADVERVVDHHGVMGAGTSSAIAAYQRDAGLPATGSITPELVSSLNNTVEGASQGG